MIEINENTARRVLEVVDAGLVQGRGLPHGDDPACVSPTVRRLASRLNDARWSSPLARAKGLRRLAIAQLGSAGVLDEREFARRTARLAIQTCVPAALRAAAAQRERLLSAAAACARDPSREHALEASAAADAAAHAAFAAHAAYTAAYAAADDAADAAYAAAYYAADAAAYAACAAAASADAAYADQSLGDFAEGVVQALIDLGAPGCEFLHLAEEAA